ncbi:Lrp/AsnC family transcriptional regulator [Metallosphaera tengchongensis]|uniref:Lrp/AsnC family transcriptional regulator n=1 Tax=Metallosphaera tengchongensis TaxID=1532350 RepID=A0A6N0P057_9CREN|nr:Lrp/AsnC family transcriptional regulator [Metallosphaera tengchongensis]QKR00670.1 Lrp/AsnC family transcriptional regulator [Metallosphaera tengchongensis]
MDDIDRQIIFNLLKDGRMSQHMLAKRLNLTPPSLNLRFRKLLEEGVIRGFKVLMNPNYLNKYFAYYAFANTKDVYSEGMFVKFNCLEDFNVYGFQGNSLEEISRIVKGIASELGDPVMEYVPAQSPTMLKTHYLLLLKVLMENPRADLGDIAHRLNYKVSKVRKLVNEITELRGFAVLPEVDLIKADSILLAIFTRRLEEVKRVTGKFSIISIPGQGSGIDVSFVGSIRTAKSITDVVRGTDPEAQVMLVYDYWIKSDVRNLEQVRVG